jgi:cell division protein FtsB
MNEVSADWQQIAKERLQRIEELNKENKELKEEVKTIKDEETQIVGLAVEATKYAGMIAHDAGVLGIMLRRNRK